MNIEDVLSSDPQIVSGAVVFKGTRVPVETLFAYLSAGDPLDTFLEDFPTVQRAQAEAVLRIASDDLQSLAGKRAA
jgi:uncharacterized protein (DUF433 family)